MRIRNKKMQTLQKQQGAALAVGLILLVIITLMGYTGMKGTMLQEKMAAGLHNRSLALGGAHSALREGEKYLFGLINNTNGINATGTPNGDLFNIYSLYNVVGQPSSGLNSNAVAFRQNDWTAFSGTETTTDFTAITERGAALSVQPEFIIQHIRSTDAFTDDGGSHDFDDNSGVRSASASGVQDAYFITAKSRSGDGKSYSIMQSTYTVVTN